MSEAKVTLPLEVVKGLFAAKNHSSGDSPDNTRVAFDIACDVIEHAARELRTLHDALIGDGDKDDLAQHAFYASEHILAGLEIVNAIWFPNEAEVQT